MKSKKQYNTPIIELVQIDRALILLQTSEETGPTPGGGGPERAPSPNRMPSDVNKFDNNPFER